MFDLINFFVQCDGPIFVCIVLEALEGSRYLLNERQFIDSFIASLLHVLFDRFCRKVSQQSIEKVKKALTFNVELKASVT